MRGLQKGLKEESGSECLHQLEQEGRSEERYFLETSREENIKRENSDK